MPARTPEHGPLAAIARRLLHWPTGQFWPTELPAMYTGGLYLVHVLPSTVKPLTGVPASNRYWRQLYSFVIRQATCLLIKDRGVSMTMELNITHSLQPSGCHAGSAESNLARNKIGALPCCCDLHMAGLSVLEQWLQAAHSVVTSSALTSAPSFAPRSERTSQL